MKSYLIFCLTLCSVHLMDMDDVFGADTDEVKSVSVTEGDSVTLNTDVTEVQRDDQILWMSGPQDTRIAEIYKQNITIFDKNEKSEDKLQMDSQTGSLTIRNIRTEHSGLYKLQILRNRGTLYKRFNLTVYAALPAPVITKNSSNSSSSSSSGSSMSNCSLLCSVENVSHVTLSWYKGNSLLSSISVSDLSISLSLPLEVEYQDKNTYSCVLNNPIRNQTKHLNMDLCKPYQIFSAFIAVSLLVALAGVTYAFYWKRKKFPQKVVFSAISYPPAVVYAPGNPVLLAPSPFVPVEYKDTDYPQTNPRKPSEVVLLTSCLQSQLQYPQTVK